MSGETPQLESVIQFLDTLLEISDFPDYEGAWNGLQLEGRARVSRVGAAVDASVRVAELARDAAVDFLLVHHGLLWDPDRRLTGRRFRRVAPLVRSGVALYACHLPLDAHPEVGNAAVLARALGLDPAEPFGQWRGVHVGWWAPTDEPLGELASRVGELLGGPVRTLAGGPERVRRLAVVTGGGGGFIPEAARAGIDTLLTGEGAHHTYLDAMEYGVNVLYGGHYATETWGVRAVAERLETEFGLPWTFLDDPSGL
jgi:dinuclear metal center YbgI/SA1388 family protein